MLPSDPQFSWIRILAYASFAALGGFMGHLMRTLDSREKLIWSRAALEGIAAGFVGLLVLFACQAMHLSEEWTGVIVGVCGWLGASGSIRMLETLIYKKLGIDKPVQPVQERRDDDVDSN